jgi:hypothetical protein
MRRKLASLVSVAALAVSACGSPGGGLTNGYEPDEPILQVKSEGGFAPVELILGRGPTYTLLGDGRLITDGPVVALYPGPLLPNYVVTRVESGDMEVILELVEEIGLPEMTHEHDDSATAHIADATTEVVTYWDDNGAHKYSVYALGMVFGSVKAPTVAFADLLTALDQASAGSEALPYEPEHIRVLAGVARGPEDPLFEDVRQWPLGDEDPATWPELTMGWTCRVFEPEVVTEFTDASQATEWLHPDPMLDAPTISLLVRPLLPGEAGCQI